jgi:hypothetical protein
MRDLDLPRRLKKFLLSDLPRKLSAVSATLAVIAAWLIGYSVFDKFEGREYGDVGFGGHVARTAEYDAWASRNDTRTRWGLIIILIGGAMQTAAALYVPPSRPPPSPERPAPR